MKLGTVPISSHSDGHAQIEPLTDVESRMRTLAIIVDAGNNLSAVFRK